MPKLDLRLATAATMIRGKVHADIGSDHGGLLVSLLKSGQIQFGIAGENNWQPLENSRRSLEGLNVDVRFGDGLSVLRPGEVDSLSICGMGGQRIVEILDAEPLRIPNHLVVQPNRKASLIRQWALKAGFRLLDEQIVGKHRLFEIISFFRDASDPAKLGSDEFGPHLIPDDMSDPAYVGLDLPIALEFGPLNLKRQEPKLMARLREEQAYLSNFKQLDAKSRYRLTMIRMAIVFRPIPAPSQEKSEP